MNGGLIGAVNPTSVASAKGIWDLDEQKLAQQQGLWPPFNVTDPFWQYVTLLLSGETATTNGAQNNTFLDSSSNNFTLTKNGDVIQSVVTPFGAGESVFFDGGANILQLPTSSEFNVSGGTWTLECWVYLLGAPSVANRLITIGPNGAQSSVVLTITPSLVLEVGVQFGTGGGVSSGSSTIPLNRWVHLGFSLNNNTASLYIDGTRVGQSSGWNITSSSSNYLHVGYQNVGTVDGKVRGYVSNVRFVKDFALYSGTSITVPTSPLTAVAGTKALLCQDVNYKDNSVNNWTITGSGTFTISPFSPFSGSVISEQSYSTYFDGTGDYLTVSNPPTSIRDWSTSDFTCEAWIYPRTFTGWYYESGSPTVVAHPVLVGNNVFNSDVNYWSFGIASNTGQVRLYYFNGAAVYPTLSTQTCNLNQWNHIAFTKLGSTVTYWINGINGGSFTVSGTPQNSSGTPLTIGAGNNTYINGYIGGIRITSGSALYTSNFTPPTAAFSAIAGTSLLTCQSSTVRDISANNLTITRFGDVKPSTVSPFATTYIRKVYDAATFGGSMYLDGTGDYINLASQSALNLGTNNFTLEMWFYDDGSSLNYPTIFGNVTGWQSGSFSLRYNNTGQAGKVTIHWNPGDPFIASTNTFPTRTWNHIAFTRSGNTFTLYVNGNVEGTATSSNSMNFGFGGTNIGWSAWDGGQGYFKGFISGVRLVSGSVIYTGPFVPEFTPPTAVSGTVLLVNATNAGVIDSARLHRITTVANSQVSTSVRKFGYGSYLFDGSVDHLSLPNSNLFLFEGGDYTVEAWVYPISMVGGGSVPCIAGIWSTVSPGKQAWMMYFDTTGSLKFVIDPDDTVILSSSSGVIQAGVWQHVAVTKSGSAFKAFVNGMVVATASQSHTMQNGSGALEIGDVSDGGSHDLNGYVSDLRITKGLARYTSAFTPPVISLGRY